MSACNLIVRPEAAYLVCDTGWYAPGGAVAFFRTKVTYSARLRLAIARVGRASTNGAALISAWFDRQHAQADAIAALPSLLADLVADCDAVEEQTGGALSVRGIGLAVASYSLDERRSEGYVIATDRTVHKLLEPMKPRKMQQLISPAVVKSYLGDWPFDPVADGRDLLEAQRATQHFADRQHIVGGAGQVVRVSADGVTVETICHWPDRAGARIDFVEALVAGPPPPKAFSFRQWISARLAGSLRRAG